MDDFWGSGWTAGWSKIWSTEELKLYSKLLAREKEEGSLWLGSWRRRRRRSCFISFLWGSLRGCCTLILQRSPPDVFYRALSNLKGRWLARRQRSVHSSSAHTRRDIKKHALFMLVNRLNKRTTTTTKERELGQKRAAQWRLHGGVYPPVTGDGPSRRSSFDFLFFLFPPVGKQENNPS